MPIKEFECVSCGHKFDEILGIKDPNPSKCPKCGAESLKQLLSTFRIAGVRSKSAAPDGGPPEEGDDLGAGPAGALGGGMEEGFDPGGMGEDLGEEDNFGGEEDAEGGDFPDESSEPPAEEDKE